MSGVGRVPRKMLWTRQDGGSGRRMRTSRRRQCQGRNRRVDIHSQGQQLCIRIKMSVGTESARHEARGKQTGQTGTCKMMFDDKHNKARRAYGNAASAMLGERAPTPRRRFREVLDLVLLNIQKVHIVVASSSPWSSRILKPSQRPPRPVCHPSTSCASASPTRLVQTLASVSCPQSSVSLRAFLFRLYLSLTHSLRMLGFVWIHSSRMCRS